MELLWKWKRFQPAYWTQSISCNLRVMANQ